MLNVGGQEHRVEYVPGESTTGMFGGNSNWRGPIWFPVNYLLIEALERYHHFYGDSFKVECPVGSGKMMNSERGRPRIGDEVNSTLPAGRIGPAAMSRRQIHRYATDPHWKDLVLFHEYFHGDNGRGVGASHQTGWTALVASLIHDVAQHARTLGGTITGRAGMNRRRCHLRRQRNPMKLASAERGSGLRSRLALFLRCANDGRRRDDFYPG